MKKKSTVYRRKATFKQNTPDNKLNYSQFTFTDNFTNKKIILKDAQEQYEHSRSLASPAETNRKQFKQINQYVSLLKSTKFFQKNQLRNKLFKSAHHDRSANTISEYDLTMTKRGLKKIIETTIDQINRKEFQQWLVNSNKKITPQVMSLHNISGHRITRSNFIDVINRNDKIKSEEPAIGMTKNTKNEAQIQIKEEKDLRQKIQHGLAAVRAHNSYLIRPKHQQELYQKLYTACRNKRDKLRKQKASDVTIDMNQQGVFQPIKAGQKVDALQKRLLNSKKKIVQPQEERELIYAVENNLFFDMELLINTKPNLINCQDRKGNNLLHIAAKNRNQSFFEFIIKKAGPQALKIRNNLGKTPLDIAKIYGVEGIVTFINNYGPYY